MYDVIRAWMNVTAHTDLQVVKNVAVPSAIFEVVNSQDYTEKYTLLA